jgi:hypothetical protein
MLKIKRPVYAYILIILASGFYPRVLSAYGFPSFVNFAHFPITLWFYVSIIQSSPTRGFNTLNTLLFALWLSILMSTIYNGAGYINAILEYLILIQPFLILQCMISSVWNKKDFERFHKFFYMLLGSHIVLCYFQHFIQGLIDDDVEGVYMNMGAGGHIAGAVGIISGLYFLFSPIKSTKKRIFLLLICAYVVELSDAKQVILALVIAIPIFMLFLIKRVKVFIISTIILCFIVNFAINQIEKNPDLETYNRISILPYGLSHKFSVYDKIEQQRTSPIQYFVGLGPGHTVSRLAQLLPGYQSQLDFLGVTTSDLTLRIATFTNRSFISSNKGSSLFSLFFSWAGIWGDIGLLGTLLYCCLWAVTLRQVCKSPLQKYLVIVTCIMGWVFSWMEEPGFMMFIVIVIGLLWQEDTAKKKDHELQKINFQN